MWWRIGWTGVDLFFVLSGFLIANVLFTTYLKYDDLQIKRFFTRRAIKIWPGYIALLLFTFFYQLTGIGGSLSERVKTSLWRLLPNLLHLQNYIGQRSPLYQTWSLAVEEHFYLLLPLVLALLCRGRKGKGIEAFKELPALFAIIAIFCLLARIATAALYQHPYRLEQHYWPTHLRLDSLLAGVTLSYVTLRNPELIGHLRRWRGVLLLIGFACFFPTMVTESHAVPFIHTAGFSLLWIGSICFICAALASEGDKWLQSLPVRVIAWVGVLSYSVYLWHMPYASLITNHLTGKLPIFVGKNLIIMLLYLILSVLLGWLSFILLEKNVLRLRDRLVKNP